jgi:hypothetical protein
MIAIMRREEESDMGGYIELLRESAREVKNCACMGLDPGFPRFRMTAETYVLI